MNKYTFNWSLAPEAPVVYEMHLPPFDAVVRGNSLTLATDADAADKQRLRENADRLAHDLALVLSYSHGERFEVTYQTHQVATPSGEHRVSISAHITGQATLTAATLDFEHLDADGNVVDSSALRREQQHKTARQKLMDLARRAPRDPDLRAMLDLWRRYMGDPDRRFHPAYDVLEIAERVYGGTKGVVAALGMTKADLKDLARISNDPKVLNGRHPGIAQGPHRIATEAEVVKCESVARAIIENHASKVISRRVPNL